MKNTEEQNILQEEKSGFKLIPGIQKCPVCYNIEEAVFGFLGEWQYRLSSEVTMQETFALEGGFCTFHTWQLEAYASPRGLSIGLPRLCERVSRELAVRSEGSKPADNAPNFFSIYGRSCRVCEVLKLAETDFCDGLTALLATEEGRKTYTSTDGVCLRHLERIVNNVPQDVATLLFQHASSRFSEITEDMRSYVRKHDALRRDLLSNSEASAYLRAINNIAGARQLQTL